MDMRDSMWDDTALRSALAPALRANGAVNGTAVDTRGNNNFYRVGMLVVIAGAITDGSTAFTLQESDDASTWAAFTGPTQGVVPALGAAQSGGVWRMALDGFNKRYLRTVATVSGATTGGIVSACVLLRGGAGQRPIS